MSLSDIKQLLKDERIHALIKYNTFKKFLNLLTIEYQKHILKSYLHSYPIRLTIEPTDICNLKCIHCLTGKGDFGRDNGFMRFDSFQKIIDEIGEYAYIADIYMWGEPFLNKEIYRMIKYAEDNNICATIHSNFNIQFNETIADKLIKSGLSYLTLSLDGADQEVYEKYRHKGNFQKAVENAKILIKRKRELKSKKPFLTWQFLVFEHNSHQIRKARKIAIEMGFDRFKFHKGFTATEIFNYSKDKNKKIPKRKDIKIQKCDWLWTNATFHWDEMVGSCCLQYKQKDDFGSLKNSSFKDIWNNDKFRYARKLFGSKIKEIEKRDDVVCSRCFKVKGV